MNAVYWLIIITLFCCKCTRCIIFNMPFVIYYICLDVYLYFKEQRWKRFKQYGIDMYVGMFGHGKTLSMTHKARKLYKKHGEYIRIVSNYELKEIPYIPLVNFQQLVDIGKEALKAEESSKYLEAGETIPPYYYDKEGKIKKEYRRRVKTGTDAEGNPIYERKVLRPIYKGTVVLIDEIEDLLSHRNYASFPLEMLNVLTQQRKAHVYIMCSAQRFFMVDKIFRSITTHVIDCNKYWRLQHMRFFDAWDYENAMNTQLIKQLRHRWWFVKDKDYNSYDTSQMISESMSADFISNDEKLARIGLDSYVNSDAVKSPSKKLKKQRKKK